VEAVAAGERQIPPGTIPMTLPIRTPYFPMEAQIATSIPEGSEWQFEPKWDGFRALVFRDGERVEVQSKSGKPMARYFPELVSAVKHLKAKQFVLDGEIVIPVNGQFSFDDLLMRIHPSATRVNRLSVEHPAVLSVFDLLVDEKGKGVFSLPLEKRRLFLSDFAKKYFADSDQIRLSPATTDMAIAKSWLADSGSNMDGVIAKNLRLQYQSGNRTGMLKIKRVKTADCVVGGFRYLAKKRLVGSLLLGLYDDEGKLNHIGFTSAIKNEERQGLTDKLEPLIKEPGFTGRAPGGESRWSTKESSEWQPLRPKLVVEVQYDHFTGGRFRHGTKLLRWRPDKSPKQCTMEQVKSPITTI
jgi:ATP-dependent DNA ligase